MTREEAIAYFKRHIDLYCVTGICREAEEMAIQALEQEPSEDAISRQAVENKLVELCNSLEEIFANIRSTNVDESVCGLCEYDCPAPFECKGFETNECFKLADEIKHKWQSTKDLPSVIPKEPKTVLYIGDGYADGYMVYDMAECPNCGYEYEDGDKDWGLAFCPNCGQKLNWESEDKE